MSPAINGGLLVKPCLEFQNCQAAFKMAAKRAFLLLVRKFLFYGAENSTPVLEFFTPPSVIFVSIPAFIGRCSTFYIHCFIPN